MTAQPARNKTRRSLVSVGISIVAAALVGVWAFFFAVRPVWSTSAQVKAERAKEQEQVQGPTDEPTADLIGFSSPRLSWEEVVTAFREDNQPLPIQQALEVFDGIQPSEFFRIRRGLLSAPVAQPGEVVEGAVKLYMIPNRTFFFRLEDFNIPAGPGYALGLSMDRSPKTGEEVRAQPYFNITFVENFSGNWNIVLSPDSLVQNNQKPTRYKSLVIWNPEYNVVVATAPLD